MSIAENIKRIREKYGLTQDELGEIAGVSGGAVSTWERGTAEPRMGAIQKISDHLHISKAEIVSDYIPEEKQKPKAIRIPILGSVPAGIPIEAVEDIIGWEEIPEEITRGNRDFFALRVRGDSMEPKYYEGDVIILLKSAVCESGDDCVVYVNGNDATLKKVIKRMDGIILQPLNPIYEPGFYDYEDGENPVEILGIVVEIRRRVHNFISTF